MPNPLLTALPEIKDRLLTRIFCHFDNRTFRAIELASHAWRKEVHAFYQRLTTVPQQNKNLVLSDFECAKLTGGMTNFTYRLRTPGSRYVVRLQGNETSLFINRADEGYNAKIASQFGINPAILYFDPQSGSQVTAYLDSPHTMTIEDLKDTKNIETTLSVLKRVHTCGHRFSNDIDVFARNQRMRAILDKRAVVLPDRYHHIEKAMPAITALITSLGVPKVPCHNDVTHTNFLQSNGKMYLIDWEYSGNNFAIWDLVCQAMESEFDAKQIEAALHFYYGNDVAEQRYLFTLLAPVYEYWVALWVQVQLAHGNGLDDLDSYTTMEEKRLTHCIALLVDPAFAEALLYFQQKPTVKHLGLFAESPITQTETSLKPTKTMTI